MSFALQRSLRARLDEQETGETQEVADNFNVRTSTKYESFVNLAECCLQQYFTAERVHGRKDIEHRERRL